MTLVMLDPGFVMLDPSSSPGELARVGGGKAAQLAALEPFEYTIPSWFCVPAEAFDAALEAAVRQAGGSLEAATLPGLEKLPLPEGLADQVRTALVRHGLDDEFVAVRSSGLDEDGAEHSFAGQFESFLYRRGEEQVLDALRRCWASAFSERITAYRRAAGMADTPSRMGVIVQLMVDAESAGVAFSRNPLRPADRDTIVIESVWGQGEGLVGGELEADRFDVDRHTLEYRSVAAEKAHLFVHDKEGGGTKSVALDERRRERASLEPHQVQEVARLAARLEEELGSPQDCEWAFSGDRLYVLQSRPITTLPPQATFDPNVTGGDPVIWDNSNIIESYAGVTTPLTFSHVSRSYREVYYVTCRIGGVPQEVMDANEYVFRNMLGLIRGRIYYNLANWYRLLSLFPLLGRSKGFMETMMGVRQSLTGELAELVDPSADAPRYGLLRQFSIVARMVLNLVGGRKARAAFLHRVDGVCRPLESMDLGSLSLHDQLAVHRRLEDEVLRHWTAPINNDTRCMIAFGLLTTLTRRWIAESDESFSSVHNDLLCGDGDLKSTEPTRILLAIARDVAEGDEAVRKRFMGGSPEEVWERLGDGLAPELLIRFEEYLRLYGFRCVDELKLEAPDLHDQPHLLVASVQGYLRHGVPSAEEMRARETAIRQTAEQSVRGAIRGPKRWFYFLVVAWARRAVSDRELLRFERTRAFGVMRRLFRGIGKNLTRIGVLSEERDVFYLTVEEVIAFGEGRPITLDLERLAALRRREYDDYRRSAAPPDRFLTRGAVGASLRYPALLCDQDLLAGRDEEQDPEVMRGTPCCPGVVEAPVLVATRFEDCEDVGGKILVTERTDPGWIPVFPACAGLIIERGSLLSHSAVVARELGVPTIVGVQGKPLSRLVSGQRVRMDAAKGEVRILS